MKRVAIFRWRNFNQSYDYTKKRKRRRKYYIVGILSHFFFSTFIIFNPKLRHDRYLIWIAHFPASKPFLCILRYFCMYFEKCNDTPFSHNFCITAPESEIKLININKSFLQPLWANFLVILVITRNNTYLKNKII